MIVESFGSLKMLARFASVGRRFGGVVMSAMLIAAFVLPYARPLVCDATGHEASAVEHLNHEASAGSQVTDAGPCHAIMDCCVVPVAPASDRPDGLGSYQHPSTEPPVPELTPLSNATSPLTPPPKV